MAITVKDFPKKVYIYLDQDGKEKWMISSKSLEECASLDEDRLVGVYTLEKVGKALTSVVLGSPGRD